MTNLQTDDRKDNDSSKHGGKTVGKGDHDGISVTIVIDRVVRGEGDEASKGETQGEEYLRARFEPDHRIRQGVPLK